MSRKIGRAGEKLYHEGPLSVLSSSLSYISRSVYNPLFNKLYLTRDRIVTRSDLKNVANFTIPIGQSEEMEFNPPKYTGEYSQNLEDSIGTFKLGQPFVCEIPNATLIGPDGVTISSDGRFVLENSRNRRQNITYSLVHSFPSWTNTEPRREIECAVSLVGPSDHNYYHWFVEYLPRLYGARVYEEQTGSSPKLLIPSNPPEWMETSLKLLDYWSQVVEWSGNQVEINRLVVPTMFERNSNMGGRKIIHSKPMSWIRSQISQVQRYNQGQYPNYIYISRNDADSRRIKNESELLNVLPSKFRTYKLSELSLVEQIELFSSAEIVIGPHGAGLTNILWGFGITVLEISGQKDNPCYFRLAQVLGHEYSNLRGEKVYKDITVDINEFERLIGSIMNNSEELGTRPP